MAITDPRHQHTREEERTIRDAALDRTIEETFPASDPPSSTPNPDDHDAGGSKPARDEHASSTERAPRD